MARAAVAVLACTALVTASGSKLPGSRVPPPAKPDQACDAGAAGEPPMPAYSVDGVRLERPVSEVLELDGRTVHLRELHEELQLTYVHGLLSAAEAADLVRLADARGGFIRSPLKAQGDGETLVGDERRNSTSCPMLWPLVYAGQREQIAAHPQGATMLEELDLVTAITERVAALFRATGMELTAEFIEPLQLVRYRPSELFGPHYDYHEVDPATGRPASSSVQGEQRAFTLLLFGSTLGEADGGETHFPHLNASVSPREGDGIIWANVDAEGDPNPRSRHQGRPPARGEKIAMNVWIADRPFDVQRLGGAVVT